MKAFTNESLYEIVIRLRDEIQIDTSPGRIIEFAVPNPDLGCGKYSGALHTGGLRHHSFKNWLDLAEALDCRLLLPQTIDEKMIRLRLQILDKSKSWHQSFQSREMEKYGADSGFSRINKFEEPVFLLDFLSCLHQIDIQPGWHILNLGINRGDEFTLLEKWLSPECRRSLHLTGIDFSASAIAAAQQRFGYEGVRFICADFNEISALNLGRFELILSIGTLHSPGIERQELLRQIVQKLCYAHSIVLFAFPNCRYFDGEIKYGARMKNFTEPELSLLFKDVAFFKKYLQQHKFSVRIFGKYYIFVLGKRSR